MEIDIKKELSKVKTKGEYAKTDIGGYAELKSGTIKAALLTKTPSLLYPIFNLIEDKDSSLGAELEKRYNTIEGKFITHKLDTNFNDSIAEIVLASLDATLFGIGVVELYLNASLEFRFARVEKELFHFQDEKLFLKSGKTLFEPTTPRFFVFKKKPLLTKVIWIVYAKHFVLSHYLKFTEFLGIPPIVANASSSDEETIAAIADALANIKSGSYAVLGPNDIINVLEGRGSQADFLEFVRYCDAEIAKIINGSVLSSNTAATYGSLAQAKVHEENRYEIVAKDARFAERCINQTFEVIGLDAKSNVLVEKDADLYQRAQTLQILSNLGYTLSPAQIAKEFDMPLPLNNTSQNRISRNAANRLPLSLDRFDAGMNSPNFKDVLNTIETQINNSLNSILTSANSYEEAFMALANAYPNANLDLLEEAMFRAVANSALLGSVD
jgi:phage gp29-like protein